MKRTIHCILNVVILIGTSLSIASCTSAQTANLPPIKIIGKYKDRPVSVTIYPDGSKPTELEIDGQLDQPIEIDLSKK